VSGGQRNERKRRQQGQEKPQQSKSAAQAAKSVSSARGAKGSRNSVIAGVAVVIVLAVAVIGGVLYTQNQSATQDSVAGQIRSQLNIGSDGVPVTKVSQDKLAPRIAQPGVVQEGNPDATMTVDVYEDFLCPYCGELFKQSHKEMEQAVDNGQVKMNYHLVNFLDEGTQPPGYSTRAASAGMCSVDSGKFRPYYEKLFSDQPEEGGPGYTNQQLIAIGKQVGLGQQFSNCVQQGKYTGQVRSAGTQAQLNLAKVTGGQVGTPTVLVAGKQIEALGKPEWLRELIGPSKS
jgi:protein-disulfide isomerase